MSNADLHGLKIFLGVVLAGIFIYFVSSFAKSVVRAQGIKYNWFGVVLSFLAIGLALYLVFFVQL
jgi:hypothetical protein